MELPRRLQEVIINFSKSKEDRILLYLNLLCPQILLCLVPLGEIRIKVWISFKGNMKGSLEKF